MLYISVDYCSAVVVVVRTQSIHSTLNIANELENTSVLIKSINNRSRGDLFDLISSNQFIA